jgi:hypothetical protein
MPWNSLICLLVLAAAANAVAASESPWQVSNERHRFLDAKGRPLSFEDHGEIEQAQRTAKISKTTRLGVGVSNPKKLLLELIQSRIDTWGENHVLFGLAPSGQAAPWVNR